MLDTAHKVLQLHGQADIDIVLCQIGISDDGQLVAVWSQSQIEKLRTEVSPEQMICLINLTEAAMAQFVGSLCGGRQ